tara:strand:+ start:71 stop:661 length:591 start_codon:yes stop_codon:yes gene_type:complete
MNYYNRKSYKLIFIGDSSVGKTSILKKYTNTNTETNTTIGTEFTKKYIDKYKLPLQIWDCAGQERFRALTKVYFRNTDVCILVFDLSTPSTLLSIKNYWINAYLQNSTKNNKFILVGNKSDLNINIDYTIIWDLVKIYNMKYIETSTVHNKNIDNIFDFACEHILEINSSNNNFIETDSLQLSDTTQRYNSWSSYC